MKVFCDKNVVWQKMLGLPVFMLFWAFSLLRLDFSMLSLTQVLLCHREGELVVAKDVLRIETLKVDELRAKMVDDGTEAEPASPAGCHVEDGHPLVALRHLLAPDLQGFRALHCHL